MDIGTFSIDDMILCAALLCLIFTKGAYNVIFQINIIGKAVDLSLNHPFIGIKLSSPRFLKIELIGPIEFSNINENDIVKTTTEIMFGKKNITLNILLPGNFLKNI